MFDLFRSRDTAMRYLLIVLLSLVALSMVVTLIPGFGSPSVRSNEQALAEVGDDVVTTRMVGTVIQQQIRAGQIAQGAIDLIAPQVVNQIIGELATAYQARNMGFNVSDQELITGIQGFMPQLFQGGQFVGKEVYQSYLAQMNLSIPEFEAKVKQQLLLEKLQRVAFDGIVVAPAEVQLEFQKRSEQARLEVVKFDEASFRDQIKPTRDELAAFLKQNQAMWNVPPKRNITLVVADSDQLGKSLEVTDGQLRQAYDSQRDRFKVEERAKVRHILVKADQNSSKEDKAKARVKAEDLLKQIRGGADLGELAKKNSDDPGSASKGGDLDWVRRGQTVKPFEDTAFTLKPKEVSGLVETIFGFHIIQTMEKESTRIKPFDEVKADLLSEFRKRALFEKMPALMEQARAEIQKDPAQAAQIAQKLGIASFKAQKAGPGDEYPAIGRSQDLDGALSPIGKPGATPVLQTKDNKLYIAAVTEVFPARPAELADVEKDLRDNYVGFKAREKAKEVSQTFESKMKSNGNDLRKAAKELSLKVIDTGDFDRTGQMKDVGPAAYFGEQPFGNAVGAAMMFRVGNTPYYFKVIGKTPGDPAKLEADRMTIVSIIKERKLRERRELFEEGLIRMLKSQGKVKVHDDAIKRFVTTFRG